ncbi:LuxR family transcriptional regulator [Halobacillus litoralis]|uniref:LuxR family transcriptional regulator n=1 Tax=Halobacillus litoralis TaxID=45668 RepID=UPI001CFEA2F2|nr:LuxR family transcriptional regulator [Halobacillus litoralis]
MKEEIPVFHDCEGLIYYTLKRLEVPEPYEDYYQESYLVYHRIVSSYNPSRSKFTTYYGHALYYHFQTLIRHEQRRQEAVHSLSMNSFFCASDPLTVNLSLIDIHRVLSSFEHSVLRLTSMGYTTEEIADRLNRSNSTIKRARRRSRQKLTRLFVTK